MVSGECSDQLATTILAVVRLTYYNNIVIIGGCAVPETRVVFYQEEDGEVPVLEWLTQLLQSDRKGLFEENPDVLTYVEEEEDGEDF